MPTHYSGTPEEERALNTYIKLTRAADSLATALAGGGTQGDLTPTQFGVLEVLYHLGTMCQSDLGAKLLKSGGNITLVIDNLEKRGLVRRERDEKDRRMVQIYLTSAGEKLISELFPGHVRAIMEGMSALDDREQEMLGYLCRKLGTNQPDNS